MPDIKYEYLGELWNFVIRLILRPDIPDFKNLCVLSTILSCNYDSLKYFRAMRTWTHVPFHALGERDDWPKLDDGLFNPKIYLFVTGPFIIKSAQKLLEYELALQIRPDQYPSWQDYIQALPAATLESPVFLKRFDIPPHDWRDDLFGEFSPCLIVAKKCPPGRNTLFFL